MSRGPSVPSTAVLVLKPSGDLQETLPDDVVGQFLGREAGTVRGFVSNLQKAKRDPRVKAVLLMPGPLESPYWGKVQELRDAALDLTGVASYEVFLRGTFDKVGAYPDFLKIGEYKTAPNQYTEREMTPAHREMSTALNRDMYDQLVRG